MRDNLPSVTRCTTPGYRSNSHLIDPRDPDLGICYETLLDAMKFLELQRGILVARAKKNPRTGKCGLFSPLKIMF
jgi:hypothetical protein